MNTILLYVMGFASLVVVIAGAVMLVAIFAAVIYKLAETVWYRHSAVAKNTKAYLRNIEDFQMYKRDVASWDEVKRKHVEKCSRCEYRRKSMEEDNHE